MPRLIVCLLALSLALGASAHAQDATKPETLEQRYSYAIGTKIAEQMKMQILADPTIDGEAFTNGLEAVLRGETPAMTTEEADAAIEEQQAAEMAALQVAADKALADGQAFLAEHAKTEGITATESGVLYSVTTEGDGAKPTAEDAVTVHYEGKLLNGTVFDSSYQRGEPASFPVGGVIPGWTEVLQLMPVGSKWEVWIPSELAYGPRGAGGDIGPNEVLNFTIELISIAE